MANVSLCNVPVKGLWVDSDKSGTLLEGFRPHALHQFQLLPVDEGTVLLSPRSNASRPSRI